MSFYIQKGEELIKLTGPTNIYNVAGELLAECCPKDVFDDEQKDTGQETMLVNVHRSHLIVTGERGQKIYVGQQGVFNSENVLFTDLITGERILVGFAPREDETRPRRIVRPRGLPSRMSGES